MEEKNFGQWIKYIHNIFQNKKNSFLIEYELTSSQAEVLLYLFKHQKHKVNQRMLEKQLNLSNPTINGILNRLEIKGFIKREIDELDARNKNIILLAKSKTISKNMKKELTDLNKRIFHNIPDSDQRLVLETLKKVAINLKEEINQ